jgi:predicted HTH transcriptional regulator
MAVGSADARLVQRLLEQQEDDWVEFKTSWFEPAAVGRYVSALANGARLAGRPQGYLVWGVSDDGAVVGTAVDPARRKVGNQPFEFWLTTRVRPTGHPIRFLEVTVGEHALVIMEVGAAQTVPVRFDGVPYVRVGSATPPLEDHPNQEKRLLELLVQASFEGDSARENLTTEDVHDLLDVGRTLELLHQPAKEEPSTRLEDMVKLRLLEQESANRWSIPNRTALLFATRLDAFGHRFERRAPRVVFYEGDNRVNTRFEQAGARGYAIGFENLFRWIDQQLPRSEQLQGVLRREHPLYPLPALRELVANALVHQDFTVGGAGPMIEVFDHRVEISNPGHPLINVDRLIDEPPRSRNERIAYLMRQMGYCEERGSGIDKVVSLSEVWQLPPPDFEIKSSGFVATLFAPRSFLEMTAQERTRACYQHASLLWASGKKAMTNATLRARFGLDDEKASQISRLISEALASGVIKGADPTNRSRAQASYHPYWA